MSNIGEALERFSLFGGRRAPVVLQTESAECSLACLAMVASWHGYQVDLRTLRTRFALSLKGVGLERLMAMAASLGLQSQAMRLELNELTKLSVPCILHWDLNHFVVLVRASGQRITIHDPASGRRVLKYNEVSNHFTGIAVELSPSVDFGVQRSRPSRISFKQLWGPITGLKRSLSQVILLSLVLQVFALVSPLLMQGILDNVLVADDRNLLLVIVIGMGLLLISSVATDQLRAWSLLYLSTRVGVQWFGSVFRHLLRLPMEYFEKRHIGDIVSRAESVNIIQSTLTSGLVGAVLDGIMAAATLVLMLRYSPSLAVVTLVAVGLYLSLRVLCYPVFRRANEEQLIRSAKERTHFLESIRGVQSLKLASKEVARYVAWRSLLAASLDQSVRIARMGMIFGASSSLIFGAERIAVIALGSLLVVDGRFTVGMLVAYLAYKDQFSGRIGNLIDTGIQLLMLRLHGERLADIVLTAPDGAENGDVSTISPSGSGIRVQNLGYRYADGEPWVIKECSFTIRSGESVAIIGPSGCGKSTLLKLLLGLLRPIDGSIEVGMVDLQRMSQNDYREKIGVVMQDDQLFVGSVYDNIVFFDTSGDMERAKESAKMAAIHDEIAAMPMGYNTLIGDMGTTLSGGQKQRVLLARALYRNPDILFLDEATSHLDVEREKMVNEAVRGLNLTRVIIAHRQETIASADRVLVMQRGRVVREFCPHESSSDYSVLPAEIQA